MLIKDLLAIFDAEAPFANAEEWDNCGLLVGNIESEVTDMIACLDFNEDILQACIDSGFNTIISHHPLFFTDENGIINNVIKQTIIDKLNKHNINFIALHTNFDKCEHNMSQEIAKLLDLEVIEPAFDNFGVICKPVTNLTKLAKRAKQVFELNYVSASINIDYVKPNKIAVISGSGKDYWRNAQELGCNVMLTGDVTHHYIHDAFEEDFCFIDIKHHAESVFCDLIIELLKQHDITCYAAFSNDLTTNL